MRNLDQNRLTINAVLNLVKQFVSIVFPLITFPYISRVLGVEYYGQVNYTASIISYISLIAGLGISNYAVREGSRLKDDDEKFKLFVREIFTLNSLALIVAYGVLTIIIIIYGYHETYRILLLIQGISVFFNVLGCEWLNIIYEDYLFITVRYIVFQTLTVCLTFLVVKSPQDLFIYALISQMSAILANTLNIIHFHKKWGIKISLLRSRRVFLHLRPVMILFGNAVSMLIYVNSDITLVGIFCGDREVGVYSVAVKIYTIVKQLLNAILVVGVPRLSRWTGKKEKSEVEKQLNKLLRTLLLLSIPAIVGLFCLSSFIVELMAGDGYDASASALRILAITLFFSTGVCFYSNLVLIPNNMEKYILKATINSAILNIILNLVMIPKFGMIAAAYTTLLSEAYAVIYMLVVSKQVFFPSVLKMFIACLISGGIVYACCLYAISLQISVIHTISIAIVVSVISWLIYWLIIYKVTNQSRK